jgi:transcriptional regulator with XRE-family HTH domain
MNGLDFKGRLKILRNSRKLTQKELADKLEMTRETISAYENGYAQPSLDVLIKLCDFYHVSADYLLARENSIDTSGQVDAIKPILDEMLELNDFISRYAKVVISLQTIVNK